MASLRAVGAVEVHAHCAECLLKSILIDSSHCSKSTVVSDSAADSSFTSPLLYRSEILDQRRIATGAEPAAWLHCEELAFQQSKLSDIGLLVTSACPPYSQSTNCPAL